MRTVMMLTPVNNIKNNRVIYSELVFTKTYNWIDEIDVGKCDSTELSKKRVCDVSIFDDYPYINNEFHIVIHIFSSSNIHM